MKMVHFLKTVALAGMLAFSAAAGAQSGMGKYQQLYAAGSQTIVSGMVESVDLVVPPGVRTQAVYLRLKTDAGPIDVQLGPEWFVQQLPARIDKGDKVEVSGAKVMVEGKSLLLAAQLKKRGQVLVFRSSTGVPAWSSQ